MMKKLFSLILSVLMIASCTAFVSAATEPAYENGAKVAFVLDQPELDGTNYVLPVSMFLDSSVSEITGATIVIDYDDTKLTYVTSKKKSKFVYNDDEEFESDYDSIDVNPNGDIVASFAAGDGYSIEGVLLQLQFTPIEGATGKAEFKVLTSSGNATTMYVLPDGTENGIWQANSTFIQFAVPKFDVTFETEIGDAPEAMIDVEGGTEIDLPELSDTDDYLFLGWSDGGAETLTGKYTVNSAVTLTAVWSEIVKYDVIFMTDHGEAPESMTDVVVGTEIDLPELSDTEDFIFLGWSDGENVLTGKYTVNADVTFKAAWKEIVRFTVSFSEGAEAETVLEGESVTLPELSDANGELTFIGWKLGDTDTVIAGGEEYTPTADVSFTAIWKGTKVYISDNGDDANSGMTADTPVKHMKRARELLAGEDMDTLVVVGRYTNLKDNKTWGAYEDTGVAGKTITITGYDETAVYDMNAGTPWNDEKVSLVGPVILKDIIINAEKNDGYLYTNGHKFIVGENVTFEADITQKVYANGSPEIIIGSGKFQILPAGTSSGSFTTNPTVTINGGEKISLGIGKGNYANPSYTGRYLVTINGGENTEISMNSAGTAAALSYRGLRYFTINGGTITNVITTGSDKYQSKRSNNKTTDETYKYTDGKHGYTDPMDVSFRKGVTVFEINAPGAVTGEIKPANTKVLASSKTNLVNTNEYAYDDATRVVIYNNESYVEGQVLDEGAYVLNVVNGSLSAVTTEFDASKVAEWADAVELLGFAYTLPEGEQYNSVVVGEEIYALADLENDLIPVPAEAGLYDVEFINAFTLTLISDGETVDTIGIIEGTTYDLERLPQNGDLKHIGWATTEGETVPTLNYDATIGITGDTTLYAVWSEAIYFTATFVTEHGTAPEPISIIDDDEDGEADEAITFTGYTGKVDDHFTFDGWVLGNETYVEGDTYVLTSNVIFTAKWIEDPKATVVYRNESGDAPEAYDEYIGTEIVVAECPAVEGYEFLGWIADGVTYQPGDKITLEDGITFTAKWGVKVAVDANGAKGELPVIGGAIGEEIDLPTSVELTKVNNVFVGFSLTPDGEVITGKYTVNPEDTLYVIWEEDVDNAAIIETVVTYYSGSGEYKADMYFYGADANTVAFGYAYGENLEFVSFVPAQGLTTVPGILETADIDGYYAFAVTNEVDGKIEAADAVAGEGVHLGTLNFNANFDKADYSEDDEAYNVTVTAPAEVIDFISSELYFLYTPVANGLEIEAFPVVFDVAFTYETIDVVYPVTGSVKLIRDDAETAKNFAEINVYNEQGVFVKSFDIEDAETTTVDGVIDYEIALSEGEYILEFVKTGYLAASVAVSVEAQEGADEDGFVPTPVEVELVELVAGNVVEDNAVIDLLDFAAITSVFGRGDIAEEIVIALDINEDGLVSVDDLAYVKANFGATAE